MVTFNMLLPAELLLLQIILKANFDFLQNDFAKAAAFFISS